MVIVNLECSSLSPQALTDVLCAMEEVEVWMLPCASTPYTLGYLPLRVTQCILRGETDPWSVQGRHSKVLPEGQGNLQTRPFILALKSLIPKIIFSCNVCFDDFTVYLIYIVSVYPFENSKSTFHYSYVFYNLPFQFNFRCKIV